MRLLLRVLEIIAYMAISYAFFSFINQAHDLYQAAFFAAVFFVFFFLAGFSCYQLEKDLKLTKLDKNENRDTKDSSN